MVKFGLDYYINDKNTLSVFTSLNTSNSKTNGESNAIYANDNSLNQTQLWFDDGEDFTAQYNFDYKIDFNDEGHNLELEIDHNIYERTSDVDFLFT